MLFSFFFFFPSTILFDLLIFGLAEFWLKLNIWSFFFIFTWFNKDCCSINRVPLHMITSLKPLPRRWRHNWQGNTVSPPIGFCFGSGYQEKVFWFCIKLILKIQLNLSSLQWMDWSSHLRASFRKHLKGRAPFPASWVLHQGDSLLIFITRHNT